jgi:NAD(P)-dependent dehydrogenase (short-subunit alcohol dehydrogenase family)
MAKVAVISGCSSGFGMLAAIEMARAGFQVIATMRDPNASHRLLTLADEGKVRAAIDVRRLDITKASELSGIVAQIVKDHGRIDVLVNNAGYALAGFNEDVTEEELRAQLDTNLFGHINLTKAVIPTMRKQQSGHVIMVSSIAGLVANPMTGSYSTSKFALEGWSESLRIELRSLGIRVVLVEPGAFATDIWEKNVRIGARAQSEESPNRERAKRFAEVIKTKVHKADPWIVARLITKVAQDPNPKLRYLVGKDARVRFWTKRLLPWKSYEKLVGRFTRIDE